MIVQTWCSYFWCNASGARYGQPTSTSNWTRWKSMASYLWWLSFIYIRHSCWTLCTRWFTSFINNCWRGSAADWRRHSTQALLDRRSCQMDHRSTGGVTNGPPSIVWRPQSQRSQQEMMTVIESEPSLPKWVDCWRSDHFPSFWEIKKKEEKLI